MTACPDEGDRTRDRIHITYNRRVTLDEMMGGLSEQYDAVFMGAGLGRDRISGVEIGEELRLWAVPHF